MIEQIYLRVKNVTRWLTFLGKETPLNITSLIPETLSDIKFIRYSEFKEPKYDCFNFSDGDHYLKDI